MAFAQSSGRSIPGAVATLGVSDRVTFIRKTYAHLGVSLLAFAALTGGMIKFAPDLSWGFAKMFLMGRSLIGMLAVMALFIVGSVVSQRLAQSQTSRGLQYLGLALNITIYSLLLQPVIWELMLRFSDFTPLQVLAIRSGDAVPTLNGQAASILLQAIVVTMAIFTGLTLTVFVTKKDFSFLRGILVIGSFAVFGVILAAMLFGFSLGAVFCGAVILLMAGYILFQTSSIMKDFPPTAYVAAALMLFSTVATLFLYVLRLFMEMNRR